jgi:hypothetical protein
LTCAHTHKTTQGSQTFPRAAQLLDWHRLRIDIV